jgi:NAD(P)H-hydrate repair Nnr-like enzyme with NAD(P)H-hydrate epimerase domain
MKILSAPQIRLADQQTIAHRHITSADLMEQAAAACVDYILGHSAAGAGFIILCGKGNNGGDGLAIARLLTRASRQVHVYILEYTASGSFDFLRHYELLRPLHWYQ